MSKSIKSRGYDDGSYLSQFVPGPISHLAEFTSLLGQVRSFIDHLQEGFPLKPQYKDHASLPEDTNFVVSEVVAQGYLRRTSFGSIATRMWSDNQLGGLFELTP